MLKVLFPFAVRIPDCDGVVRTCATLADIVKLAEEKADRYNDSEAKRFVKEINQAAKPAPHTPAKQDDELMIGDADEAVLKKAFELSKLKTVKAWNNLDPAKRDGYIEQAADILSEPAETTPPAAKPEARGTAKAARTPTKAAAKAKGKKK